VTVPASLRTAIATGVAGVADAPATFLDARAIEQIYERAAGRSDA
jgi:hypothetical protein